MINSATISLCVQQFYIIKKIAALQKQSLGVQQFFNAIKLLHCKKEGPFATENSVY